MAISTVRIKLDQQALQTLKMGLAALQLNAQAVQASLDTQVQAAIDAEAEEPQPNQPPKWTDFTDARPT